MTDIEQKALALLNGVEKDFLHKPSPAFYRQHNAYSETICRAIEQHEAFRQEVSDAIVFALKVYGGHRTALDPLRRFIIPKPDPLVEAMHDCGVDRFESWADQLRAAMKARGYEWRKIEGEG